MPIRKLPLYIFPALTAVVCNAQESRETDKSERPNILWLTFEDTSASNFGCYGNINVHTPTVDSLASAGVQYMNVPVEIDEKTLTEIAGTTNGNYYRATSNDKLMEVYQEIDKLEKTKLNVKEFSKREEEFELFAWIAFFCILLDILLRNTILKKIP